MSLLDELTAHMKKRQGQRYRLVRLDPENISRKKIEGYEFLRKEDPEIKGTILEHHQVADGQIRVGNLAIARIPEIAARAKEKKNEARLQRHLDAIRHNYQAAGENIKRDLGPSHAAFNPIVEDKEE